MKEYNSLYEKEIILENIKVVKIKTDCLDIYLSQIEKKENEGINDELEKSTQIENLFIKISYEKTNFLDEETLFDRGIINKEDQCLLYTLTIEDLNKYEITQANLHFSFPENILLEIETEKSNIYGDNFGFDFIIHNRDGDIFLDNTGKGQIISENGSIKIQNVCNNYNIKTINSDIRINNAIGGILNISTVESMVLLSNVNYNHISCRNLNGDSKVEINEGKVENLELVSDNGDLSFALSNNSSEYIAIKTNKGDIKIYVPNDLIVNYDLTSVNGEVTANIDPENAFEEVIDTNRFYVNYDTELTYIRAYTKEGNIIVLDNEKGIQGECFDPQKRTKQFVNKDENDIVQITEIEDSIFGENSDEQNNKQKYQGIFDFYHKENVEEINSKTTVNFDTLKKKISTVISEFIGKTEDNKEENTPPPTPPHSASLHGGGCPPLTPPTPLHYMGEADNSAVIKILEMVETKKISVEEAEKLIKLITYKQDE